ncbi:MAG: hypothetical protein PHS47_01855 [Methanocellales archaeon]|nr:hypothetical protein [Methanocellales archaeon]
MVVVENLIVKGKYFIPVKVEQIGALKATLREYLDKKGYEPEDTRSLFFNDRFLTLNFRLSFGSLEEPFKLKLRKILGFLSEEEIQNKLYFKKLETTRRELPFKIDICLSLQKVNETEGIVIEIMSKPVAYYHITQHITQMNKDLYLDKTDYSLIKHENTEFIKELMASIHARCLSEPALLSSYIQTEISQKLVSYKFDKIAQLLDEGKKRLEIGENAVGNLIGVIENFLVELIKRLDIKPAGLHQPEKNIQKLKDCGFLSDKTEGTIQSSLFHSVYRKLKDIDHKKEDIDYFDLVLYYGITESIIDYLLDKVIKYKIKITQYKIKITPKR